MRESSKCFLRSSKSRNGYLPYLRFDCQKDGFRWKVKSVGKEKFLAHKTPLTPTLLALFTIIMEKFKYHQLKFFICLCCFWCINQLSAAQELKLKKETQAHLYSDCFRAQIQNSRHHFHERRLFGNWKAFGQW